MQFNISKKFSNGGNKLEFKNTALDNTPNFIADSNNICMKLGRLDVNQSRFPSGMSPRPRHVVPTEVSHRYGSSSLCN